MKKYIQALWQNKKTQAGIKLILWLLAILALVIIEKYLLH